MILFTLFGCVPNHAEVSGDMWVWLAANSSPTVEEGFINPILKKAKKIDCVRGWDPILEDWDEGYIGPREGESGDEFFGGTCAPEDAGCDQKTLDAECAEVDAMNLHTFLQKDGMYAFKETIDPWRTEVVITSEGDFQLAFHHRLDGGEDTRVIFVIDPDFEPVECTTNDAGETAVQHVDGQSWLDTWSEGEDGTIYYLNGGSLQVNPNDTGDWWFLPSEWSAGFAMSRISAEDFFVHGTDYGIYIEDELAGTYNPNPHFLIGETGGFDYTGDGTPDPSIGHGADGFDPENPDHQAYFDAFLADMELRVHGDPDDDAVNGYQGEINNVAGVPEFEQRMEDNAWREIDYTSQGLDGWVGVQSSWVIIDDGSNIEPGGEVSGSFQIMLDGDASASALLVRGTFSTDRLKEDPWGYGNLEEELREANDNPYCLGLEVSE